MQQKVEVKLKVGVKRKLKEKRKVITVKKTNKQKITESIPIVEEPLPEIGDFKYADTPSKVLGVKMTHNGICIKNIYL